MANCVVCSEEIREDARFCPGCGAEQPKVAAPDGEDNDPMLGRTIARNFKIESLLGVGGMGKVYKARQLSLDKAVVIKILHSQFRDDPQLVQRFQREARAASRLNHPNSIQVIDFGQDEGETLYMAIEYLEGRDLFAVLQDEGPFSDERIARIMVQVCSALADAHEQHVIHRDLKPENIMVEDRRGQKDYVKVLDFGIAKIQDPENQEGQALTQAGMVCGTPEFMSPEQARGLALDARSDLYALGVVSYQLATGELPFQADTPIGIVTKHILEEPTPPREVREAVSEGLQNIILKAMAKDADVRFQSAVEMGAAFESLLYNGGFHAVSSPGLPAASLTTGQTAVGVSETLTAPATPTPALAPENDSPKNTGAEKSASSTMVLPTKSDGARESVATGQALTASDQGQDENELDDFAPGGGIPKWGIAAAAALVVFSAAAFFLRGNDESEPSPPPVVAQEAASEPNAPAAAANAANAAAQEKAAAADKSAPGQPAAEASATKKQVSSGAGVKEPVPTPDAPKVDKPKSDPQKVVQKASTRADRASNKARSRGKTKKVSDSQRKQAKALHRKANMLALSKDAGKRQEAYVMLKKALRLDPTNPAPIQAIAMIHKQNGDATKACAAMRDYVKRKGLPRTRAIPMLKRMCGDAS